MRPLNPNPMKAKITNKINNAFNTNHRKDEHFYKEYCAIVRKRNYTGDMQIGPVLILRCYATQATNYACLWIQDDKSSTHISSSGKAGGYGYHRESQAAEHAFENAGIELSEPIGGVGQGAIEEAIRAVVKALGYRKVYIHVAHM
ncbi:MAG: hypothetical protein D6732_00205 [Methanobacteriota archaeon]|nr:MAG: hypothetical protein D6732_00205 [Euryarchaeota archaeon]